LCYIPQAAPETELRHIYSPVNVQWHLAASSKMQSMQRRFGRMTTTKSADNSQVAVLLKDFEDADNLFTKVGSIVSRFPPGCW
jgi:hypothetical protein